ncbi:hypothetical protein [Sulfitobacter sp. R18_1]|uniref:hypothetical protein n=1 Tax=Sulfitobacter sp. R18_1 TaxID=2821104 RepID=UPI001ADB5CAB|nr:hypothetical protein [Sulfitobacter sp. R18_1]MBO9428088.1 hypothetical protein [Sulfitobacter sp. R18_1]
MIKLENNELVLEEMDRLDDLACASDAHIPFEAAITYYEGDEAFKKYEKHVEGCIYCKEMISAIKAI